MLHRVVGCGSKKLHQQRTTGVLSVFGAHRVFRASCLVHDLGPTSVSDRGFSASARHSDLSNPRSICPVIEQIDNRSII